MPDVQILALPSPLAPRTVPEVRQMAHDYAAQIAAMLTNGETLAAMPTEPPDGMLIITQPGATSENPHPKCMCGCGKDNQNPRTPFNQGHDPYLKSKLAKVEAGTMGMDPSTAALLVKASEIRPKHKTFQDAVSVINQRSGNAPSPAG